MPVPQTPITADEMREQYPHFVMGEQFAMTIEPRNDGPKDKHVLLRLWSEDDEVWHLKSTFSSHWADDLQAVMQKMNKHLSQMKKDKSGYGRTF